VTPRDRRALAAGAAVVAVAALCLRVLPAIGSNAMERWRRVEAASLLLARTDAELTQASRLEDSASVVKAAFAELAPKLLAGRNEADAASDLAARIGRECTLRRVRLERTEVVRDTARAGMVARTTVAAQVEGDMRGIAGLLAGLGSGSPVVLAHRIRLVAGTAGSSGGPERLRLELVVQGWYLAREAHR
jgi:precorrin-6x reductase